MYIVHQTDTYLKTNRSNPPPWAMSVRGVDCLRIHNAHYSYNIQTENNVCFPHPIIRFRWYHHSLTHWSPLDRPLLEHCRAELSTTTPRRRLVSHKVHWYAFVLYLYLYNTYYICVYIQHKYIYQRHSFQTVSNINFRSRLAALTHIYYYYYYTVIIP